MVEYASELTLTRVVVIMRYLHYNKVTDQDLHLFQPLTFFANQKQYFIIESNDELLTYDKMETMEEAVSQAYSERSGNN